MCVNNLFQFSLLIRIPLYIYTTFILLVEDIGLLQLFAAMSKTVMHSHVQVFVFSFLLCAHLAVELNTRILYLTLWRVVELFSTVVLQLYTPISNVCFHFSTFLLYNLLLPALFIIAILLVVKHSQIVFWICISLMTNNLESLFMCLLIFCILSLVKYLFISFII